MARIIWGPGLTIILRGLPKTILTPLIACSLPTILARQLPSSTPIETFLGLPTSLRAILSYLVFVLVRSAVRSHLYYGDMKKLGPNVAEVPKLRMRWPWNADLIPMVVKSQQNDYCAGLWPPILEQYGNTLNLSVLGGDQILTIEPEHVKAILSTDFTTFEKGPEFRDKMYSLLGKGVFNSDGDLWKFHRTMSRPYFTRERISHFDLFARHSDSAINKLLARLSEPSRPAIDFQDMVARFTLDSGTEFLFGKDIHSLSAPIPYPHAPPTDQSASFAAAFGRAQASIMVRFALGTLWPLFEIFWDRVGDDMRVIDEYVKPILREKLEEKRKGGIKAKTDELEDGSDTLLDHLVQYTDDETIIKDEIINILVAGRDTTATTLTFAVYLLATHPDVMAKLRAEILARVGPTNYPTPDDFREMKYLRAVLNETLRLFPAVPFNERTAVKSTVFKSGDKTYYVPKGAVASYSVLLMHRRKDLWGPDADEFDPDRWIDDRLKKYVTPNPFIFLPFNAGPRICLGQQFAYNESSFFLVRLLQRVESIMLAPEAHPEDTLPPESWRNSMGRKSFEKIWPKSHLTLYSNGGMWVRMKETASSSE
ncbi:cytochrome P450 family protein [Ceratobasidium sp. AG-Ba]|nr:cytochrome P450 family protein [Ceratobasidium sp. AG-Ba]